MLRELIKNIFSLHSGASSSGQTSSTQSHNFPEDIISKLMSNGFSRDAVISELRRANGDADQALAALFAKSFHLP